MKVSFFWLQIQQGMSVDMNFRNELWEYMNRLEQECQYDLNSKKMNFRYRAPLRVAAIGDGGNDVSMIQAAHAGIGIDAHEGKSFYPP